MGSETPNVDTAKIHAGMRAVLAKSQERGVSYITTIPDHNADTPETTTREFLVRPGIFSPEYYPETEFYANEVSKLVKPGDDFLEVGCGVGVTSIFAAKKGARVTAVDINPQAVSVTKDNVYRYGLENEMDVLESDVYDAITPWKQFDVIFWNVPFGLGEPASMLERAVFDQEYASIKKYISGAAEKRLKPGGKLLIGFSTTLGNEELLRKLAGEAGFGLNLVAETLDRSAPPDFPIKFELFQALPHSQNAN